MTVQFKGTSRQQSKHKARRRRSAEPQRTMRLAGLRSDQLGICQEPQFQSKKKVPFNPHQESTSLQWEDPGVLPRRQLPTQPTPSPAVVSVPQTGGVQNVETPLAPRASKATRPLKTTLIQEDCSSGHISRASADQETQKQPAEEVNHVLRKKAGLRSKQQRNGHRNSEYQRQFQWKSPAAESPLLTAQEMLYSSSRSIPPFKSNPVVMESEYKRSFKGSPPPKGPRLRRDMELNEDPLLKMETISPEERKKENRRHKRLSRKSKREEVEEKTPHSEQQPLQQKPETPQAQKALSPKVVRKVKTEYNSNFRSPLQYCYRDGTWVRSKTVGEEGHEWYHEVQELREKAEAYRKRAWGTHFSRKHLSQILSEQNCLWEVSSGSSPSTLSDDDIHFTSSPVSEALDLASVKERRRPSGSVPLAAHRKSSCNKIELLSSLTLPEQRRKAWDEEISPCERGMTEIKQQRNEQPEEINGYGNINGHSEDNKEDDIEAESEQESGNSSEEGRQPTPKLKTLLATHRTHHDRTTPVIGGAILVSPPKSKYTKTFRRSEPPLGKAHSPYKHLSCVSVPEKNSKTEGLSSSQSPAAAGLATVDPIPLREDTWAEVTPEPTSDLTPAKKTACQKPRSTWLTDSTPSHANKIQGTLRNPEFQHNGDLGVHRPDRIIFPSSDCLSDDDLDDRMSQISFQSAASCSMASQVLDRAQRRKEDFWGKS